MSSEMTPAADSDLAFLSGGGEMGAIMRARDWSTSPLGSPAQWPQSLRTVVRLMLNTGHPMYVFWGETLAGLYNDAYRQSIGPERHPGSLGQPGREIWDEIWPIIGPQIDQVMAGRGATWHENALVPITRHGQREDVYWTYSYSPIDDESAPGGIGGVLVLCTETTAAVQEALRRAEAVRRQTLLFDLLKRQRETEDADRMMAAAADTLSGYLRAGRVGFFDMEGVNRIVYGVCQTDGVMPPLHGPAPEGVTTAAYMAAKAAGAIVPITDILADPLTRGSTLAQMGVRSGFSVPILRGGRWIGGIYVHHGEPRVWSPDETGFVRDVADQTWDAVERARAATALRESEQRFRFLSALDEATRTVHDAGTIMEIATRMLGQHLRVSRCAYADMDEDEDGFTIRHDWRAPGHDSTVGHYSLAQFGDRAVAELKAGHVLILRDIGAELRPDNGQEMFHAIGINAIITCPLIKNGRLRALMAVHDAGAHDWRAVEIRLVQAVVERGWAHIERIRSEEALRGLAQEMIAARNAAEAATLAKTDFIAHMSHEIRTPMNAVVGAAQILGRSGALTERQTQVVGVLNDSAAALMELINQVLDLSKIEARNLQLDDAPFDARALVDEVARMMAIQAREKGLQLDIHNACDCVDTRLFNGDAARIRQILVNLCANAVKFTERGGVTLSVACTPSDRPERENLIFSVRDTGIGIEAAALEVVFNKFTQADSSISRRYGGSGLGLSIARSLAEAMGGNIDAASTPGEGSVFTVTLPLSRYEATPALEPEAETDAPARSSGARILLVEDSPANVMVAGYFLESFGYAYDVAEDGRAAVDRVQSGAAYAAILMDVQMPYMDGIEATRRIRAWEGAEHRHPTPIIAMTAHAMLSDRARCLDAGMDDYITKPFDPEGLRARLDAVAKG